MSRIAPKQLSDLRQKAEAAGQSHLFARWTELTLAEQAALCEQIQSVDFNLLERLWREGSDENSSDSRLSDLPRRAGPVRQIVRNQQLAADIPLRDAAHACGESLLRDGRVAVILVAGGEGTRLGLAGPKGMYPMGPISGHSLYQLFAEQVVSLSKRFGRTIPYHIMTSHATDQATRDFFSQESFFGLDPNSVHFVRQGVMPVVDRETGRILMSGPASLMMNPNGHGGLLEALNSSGSFDQFRRQGIDLLYYHQVDNPLTHVGDPVMLGLHHQRQAQVTVKVVAKQNPDEKMGVVTEIDGHARIIEYSDLTAEDVRRTTPEGDLLFWAGNTAIHVFDRAILQDLASAENSLPYHRAIKKVGHFAPSGHWITPTSENAIKYERFIFDVLPRIQNCLVMEVEREEEFCPLKNSTGEFSPNHVRQAMITRAVRWLRTRCELPSTVGPVEISPLFALEVNDLKHWEPPTEWPTGPSFLN